MIESNVSHMAHSILLEWLNIMPEFLEKEMGFDLSSVELLRLAQELQQNSERPFVSFEHFASQLSSKIAVHETYFLRHHEQFDWLENVWAQEILKLKNFCGEVRILSAGCSSGEEPYSVYAHLMPIFERYGVRLTVDAVDVSTSVLDIARQGNYGLWSLRGVNVEQERWLQVRSRSVEVKEWVKNGVNFTQHNLLRPFKTQHRYDLVLCRNVMIYMHPDAVRKIYTHLLNVLAPTGFIMPGPSDPTPMAVDGLQIRWAENVRLYTWFNNPLCNNLNKIALPETIDVAVKPLNITFDPVQSSPKKLIETAEKSLVLENKQTIKTFYSHTEINELISACAYDEARDKLEKNIQQDALDIRSYVMLAMLALDLNDIALASRTCQKALFLAPDALYVVYLMEQIKRKQSHYRKNNNQWLWLDRKLAELDDETILEYSDDVSVGLLKGVINAAK